jgi:hypothetical protein
MATVEANSSEHRKVGLFLGTGIFLFPFIFFWLLLRSGHSILARAIGSIWFAFLLLAVANHNNSGNMKTTTIAEPARVDISAQKSPVIIPSPIPAAPAKEIAPLLKAAPPPPAPTSNWQYSESTDEMRGTRTRFASAASENNLYFDFPYSGGSEGTIMIRSRPSDGLNIILQISKGQFICNSYSGDAISVKFDNKPIQEFPCSGANDGSANVIFIENSRKFLIELKKSSTMIIEASFYQAGKQQLKFQTSGLEWK